MPVTKPTRSPGAEPDLGASADSYRRLADVFHHILSEQSLDALLERIADALSELVPHDSLTIYEADEAKRELIPVLARDQWEKEILDSKSHFGEGITGWAVEHRQAVLVNDAHLDPRMNVIPGTPAEPESLISIPLIAGNAIKGALNLYRIGEGARFSEADLELAERFGDAAALVLDNAESRHALEMQAQMDALTGLYNHRFFHERLRSELTRASRAQDSVAVLMFDIDDFKRVNDVYGHRSGDETLVALAEILGGLMRGSDILCRLGGEEFGVIMPSCTAGDALGLASRICETLESIEIEPAGKLTVSVGVAQGPEHAMNPRELVACAEAAMMTAKTRGKNRVVLFEETTGERPETASGPAVRSIAHMKMLQSLAGKLNRLNDVAQIGSSIANELRTLIDYHSCLVYSREGDLLVPVAGRGELAEVLETDPQRLVRQIGVGILGHAAAINEPLLIGNALESEHAVQVPGTPAVAESIVAVPLAYGPNVIGGIIISQLGVDQFDADDVRLMEVLAGHASVALENARLYEMQRREAHKAKALLEVADELSQAPSFHEVGQQSAEAAARMMGATKAALWLEDERSGEFVCAAHCGFVGERDGAVVRKKIGKGSGADILRNGREPFVVGPGEHRRFVDWDVAQDVAVAPLAKADGVRGWITVRAPRQKDHHFTEDRLRLLAGLAYQASIALEKAHLYRAQKESADIANSLLEFSALLATAEDLDQVLTRTVEQTARILGSPRTLIWLQEPDSGDIVAESMWGFEKELRERFLHARFPVDIVRPFMDERHPFSLRAADLDEMGVPKELIVEDHVAVAPLKLDGSRMGFIVAGTPAFGGYEFSERKMRLLAGISHQAELAINNVMSYENLERTFVSTVEALANALEAKDEYTSDHARSITDMALEVGHAMGMDHQALKRLELGALFHDIGKIGIPSEILLKPGPLTPEEKAVMDTHPELGEKILAPIERLADVRPIVRHCHEHYDGSGYPDAVVGEDIPIESRIILVCDAFHAMTTDRPYRNRLPEEEAYRRLVESTGRQFDPRVVETFMRLNGAPLEFRAAS